jgi:hypothetical protein
LHHRYLHTGSPQFAYKIIKLYHSLLLHLLLVLSGYLKSIVHCRLRIVAKAHRPYHQQMIRCLHRLKKFGKQLQ